MDSLDKYCIYELRCIAREKGVKCPTKLKKKELIKEIHLIEKGKKQPYVKEKVGRPVGFIRQFNTNPCSDCDINKKYNDILKGIVEYISKFIV